MDKALPYDIDAERATLGSILLNRDAIVALDGWLTPDQFYVEKHGWIFEAMLACYHKRVPPDTTTVADELRRRERMDAIGGIGALIDLVNGVPTAFHVEYYGRIVERTATLRKLVTAGGQIAALGFEEREDLEQTLERAEQTLLRVRQRRGADDYVSLASVTDAYFARLAHIQEHQGELTGIGTGFVDFDAIAGGFQRGDLVILGARPAVGKTSWMMCVADYAAQHGSRVGVVSLEMSRDALNARLLALRTGIDTQRMINGRLSEENLRRCVLALGELARLPIWIDHTAGQRIGDVRAKARRLHAAVGLDMLMIDYLQLIGGNGRPENRVQEVSEISRSLKALARELDIPILALSQLSRAVEGRASKVPMLSDLRESGSIEQDADIVLFLHREELYDPDTDMRGVAELHIAKHRNGPTAVVPLRFDAATTRFQNLDRYRGMEGYE